MKDKELVLEVGIASIILLLLAGLSTLVVSWTLGAARRTKRKTAGPPSRGTMPDERHQHTSSVSPR